MHAEQAVIIAQFLLITLSSFVTACQFSTYKYDIA